MELNDEIDKLLDRRNKFKKLWQQSIRDGQKRVQVEVEAKIKDVDEDLRRARMQRDRHNV